MEGCTVTSDAGTSQWVFDCQKCSFESREDTEVEALNAADYHADYGPGHFEFEIRNPEGEVKYP